MLSGMRHTALPLLGLVLLAVVVACGGPSETEIEAIVDARVEESLAEFEAIVEAKIEEEQAEAAKAQAMAKDAANRGLDYVIHGDYWNARKGFDEAPLFSPANSI